MHPRRLVFDETTGAEQCPSDSLEDHATRKGQTRRRRGWLASRVTQEGRITEVGAFVFSLFSHYFREARACRFALAECRYRFWYSSGTECTRSSVYELATGGTLRQCNGRSVVPLIYAGSRVIRDKVEERECLCPGLISACASFRGSRTANWRKKKKTGREGFLSPFRRSKPRRVDDLCPSV